MSIVTVAFFSGFVMRFTGSLMRTPMANPVIAPRTNKTSRRFLFNVKRKVLQHRTHPRLPRHELGNLLPAMTETYVTVEMFADQSLKTGSDNSHSETGECSPILHYAFCINIFDPLSNYQKTTTKKNIHLQEFYYCCCCLLSF